MDTRALQALSYGLYIISTSSQGKNAGCVVNTVTQITSSPVKIMVAVNHQNYMITAFPMSHKRHALTCPARSWIRLMQALTCYF